MPGQPPAPAPTPAADDGSDPLRLALHLCFTLQGASRAFGGVYRHLLRDIGLTYPQYLVMLALWENGELTVKELGRLLRLDSGTLSPLLKRLEALELVTRARSAQDERSVVVRLTPAGRELRAPAERVPAGVQDAVDLDPAELRTLGDLLRRLTASLDAAAARHDS